MSIDYFDRLNRCISAWRQVVTSRQYSQADDRMKEFYADTLGFLGELLLLRGILDLDQSAHELDKDAGNRAIEEAQSILDLEEPKDEESSE